MKTTVKLVPLPSDNELSENLYRRCGMCEKKQLVSQAGRMHSERLCKNGLFYCNFCLRNGYYTRNSRNILMFSLRSLIGLYYHQFYVAQPSVMYLSQLDDYVENHVRTGLENPLFSYDQDSFIWFIDFSRVGRSRRKIKVEEVLKTITNIIACFDLPHNLPNVQANRFYSKTKEAVLVFYNRRHRPKSRRILVPTLKGCTEADIKMDQWRNFLPKSMKYG